MITIEKKRKRSDQGAANKSPGHLFYQLCVQEYPSDLLFLSRAVRVDADATILLILSCGR